MNHSAFVKYGKSGIFTLGALFVCTASTYDIPKLDKIVIDGAVTDWGNRGLVVSTMAEASGKAVSPGLFDAQLRLGWSDSGLILLVTVVDPIAVEDGNPEYLFSKDCIELFMADSLGSVNRFQAVIASGADTVQKRLRVKMYDNRSARREFGPIDLRAVSGTTPTGYRIEVLVPWRALHIAPRVGATCCIQVFANSFNGGGDSWDNRWRFVWFPSEESHRDSRDLNVVRLAVSPSPTEQMGLNVQAHMEQGTADAFIFGTNKQAGSAVSVLRGKTVIAGATMEQTNGRVVARVQFVLPAVGQKWEGYALRMNGRSDIPLPLRNQDTARILSIPQANTALGEYIIGWERFAWPIDERNALSVLLGRQKTLVTFYDKNYNEVTQANEPGRYGAVVSVVAESGISFQRFHTVFRLPKAFDRFNDGGIESVRFSPKLGFDTSVCRKQTSAVSAFLSTEKFSAAPRSAILFAGLSDMSPRDSFLSIPNYPSVIDRQWWTGLKRKLYKVSIPTVKAPYEEKGLSAPVVRKGTSAEAGMSAQDIAKIDSLCDQWWRASQEAFAVCVVRHGVVALHKAYGTRNGTPLTVHTKSWMASITKALSGTMMAILVDRRLVDLDAPVGKYLPPLVQSNSARPMTIRHLYTHTSGLDQWAPLGDEETDLEQRLATIMPYVKVGHGFVYNGVGYGVAGRVIEVVSGEAMPLFYRRHLLTPLGCAETEVAGNAGDAQSVPMDMARIGQMLLNKGTYGSMRFFGQETFKALLPIPVKQISDNVGELQWGIGFTRPTRETADSPPFSADCFGHGAASAAIFHVDPSRDLVVVVTRNTAGEKHSEYSTAFYKAVFAAADAGK